MKDLSISVGGKDLLSHATLVLHENVHYVLVGRNGSGKTTLLKAFAENRIPGIKWSLRVLLLGQTRIVSNAVHLEDTDQQTVVEYVVRSDVRRERCMRETDGENQSCPSFSYLMDTW